MKENKKYIIWFGIIAFITIGYFIADSFLFNGIKPRIINENGIQANYYTQDTTENVTAIILVGGGHWGDFWGQEFANKGYVGLSLAYTGREGLPKLPEEIDLEYFEKTIEWLKEQPEVNTDKIIVMGASRNAELALIIASIFPKLVSGVIAYSPSSVSWSNTVLPYNSNELKPSWVYKGSDIPYVAMDKLSGNNTNKIETLEYWKNGLTKAKIDGKATIRVEKINGPIILFSSMDDKVWPSSLMADMIEERLIQNNFKHPFRSIKYEKAGHLISSHPEMNSDIRTGKITIEGKEYEFEYGGTKEGDEKAKKDAKIKLMEFVENI